MGKVDMEINLPSKRSRKSLDICGEQYNELRCWGKTKSIIFYRKSEELKKNYVKEGIRK